VGIISNGVRQINDTHFISNNRLPQDGIGARRNPSPFLQPAPWNSGGSPTIRLQSEAPSLEEAHETHRLSAYRLMSLARKFAAMSQE
jgi:hypothetical protein